MVNLFWYFEDEIKELVMSLSIRPGDYRLTIDKCIKGDVSDHQNYKHLQYHVDEYKEVRDEIHYEYMLMSNRVNWLLASQTFLFTALAIATPKVSTGMIDLSQNFFYKTAPVIGLCSCWLISSAIIANILRIWDWKRVQSNIARKIKFLATKLPQDGLSGFGLLPPIGLPLLFFTMWGYVLFAKLDLFMQSQMIVTMVFAILGVFSVWSTAFCFYSLNEATINRFFKKMTVMTMKSKRGICLTTCMLFLTLLFYAIFFISYEN